MARFCARVSSSSQRPTPKRGVGGAPTGASLEHVALVGRDATLARRGPSRATGRPPLGAPPWRCRPGSASIAGTACRLRCEGSTQPGASARPRPRRLVSAVTSRGRRHSPLRRQDRLRRTPLMSEDESVFSTAAFCSQLLFVDVCGPTPKLDRRIKPGQSRLIHSLDVRCGGQAALVRDTGRPDSACRISTLRSMALPAGQERATRWFLYQSQLAD